MNPEVEQALSPLIGLPLTAIGRAANLIWAHFGELRIRGGADDDTTVGDYALHISCGWRLEMSGTILIGGRDVYVPSDPETDPDDFDWDVPGATWFDVRAASLQGVITRQAISVTAVSADECGGMRIVLTDGLSLAVFPERSAGGQIDTEFWRLFQPRSDAEHFVVTSAGIDRVGVA